MFWNEKENFIRIQTNMVKQEYPQELKKLILCRISNE